MAKDVPPTTSARSFSCPHCGAFCAQTWYDLYAEEIGGDNPTPFIATKKGRERFISTTDLTPKEQAPLLEWYDKGLSGLVILDKQDGKYLYHSVTNLHLSKCYVCHKIAVWVHDRLAFPDHKGGAIPNSDLPPDVIRDFEEARAIAYLSPRGAAALLRLIIQKLCKYLGKPGKNIDADIGALVKDGLNPLVQKSLDIVRVIGNEAVHPGVIDLNDDPETANRLFDIVNAIADQMITHPKHVKEMYGKLPPEKRDAIERRDGKHRGEGAES